MCKLSGKSFIAVTKEKSPVFIEHSIILLIQQHSNTSHLENITALYVSQGACLGALGLLSVQIALVDVLKEEYGIAPDGILGHSAGFLFHTPKATLKQHCTSPSPT